jgi:TonB family protein
MTDSPDQAIFGLLPRLEGRRRSFVTSSIVNMAMLGLFVLAGMSAPKVMDRHYEETQLIAPIPPPPMKIRQPRPSAPPKRMLEPKPVHMEAKLTAPPLPHIRPQIAHTPQPRPALAAAMPAQNKLVHPSMAPVHLGDTFGVTPNPNAVRPATVAALGNPYGGLQGEAVAPHGVVKSTGIGDSTRAGAGGGGGGGGGLGGRVASVGMPGYAPVSAAPVHASTEPQSTSVEVLSKPPVQYPAEARQLRIEGDVVLSVTFLANGQVLVQGVIHGLGHGLDQEAIRVAQQIRFRPATVNGRPVDVTTHVTIAFQLA